jgi:hypothetical protein
LSPRRAGDWISVYPEVEKCSIAIVIIYHSLIVSVMSSIVIWQIARFGQERPVTKTELHELVEDLPDRVLEGAGILLRSLSDGQIDPEQAWFWASDWFSGELETDREANTHPGAVYEDAESFKAALLAARDD